MKMSSEFYSRSSGCDSFRPSCKECEIKINVAKHKNRVTERMARDKKDYLKFRKTQDRTTLIGLATWGSLCQKGWIKNANI